jgi:uncharacterized cupredoxin-like copper-binding protein
LARLGPPIVAAAGALALLLAACEPQPGPTPRITPGTGAAPREVNVIAREWTFLPAVVDLVPGETVVLHLVNGGTEVHEAVFGGADVQAAWEAAEAAVAGAPPGPTPVVSVPPSVRGLRVVARSGERVDVTWTVPADGPAAPGGFVVGCHIPGHFAAGMVVPVRWIAPDGTPLGRPGSSPGR